MVRVDVTRATRAASWGKWPILAALVLAGGAPPPAPAARPALEATPLDRLAPGDLIFRSGRGFRAEIVRLAGHGPWSHVGLLDRDPAGRWVVIHAAPPEDGSAGGVTETSLSEFASPIHSSGIAVHRDDALDTRLRALVTGRAREMARAGVPFDDSLDLASPDALYCTEFVARIFAGAGADLGVEPSAVTVGGLSGRILMPRDLMASPRLRRIL